MRIARTIRNCRTCVVNMGDEVHESVYDHYREKHPAVINLLIDNHEKMLRAFDRFRLERPKRWAANYCNRCFKLLLFSERNGYTEHVCHVLKEAEQE